MANFLTGDEKRRIIACGDKIVEVCNWFGDGEEATVWERTDLKSHHVIASQFEPVGSGWFGDIQTRSVPMHIDAIPGHGSPRLNERLAAFDAWRAEVREEAQAIVRKACGMDIKLYR